MRFETDKKNEPSKDLMYSFEKRLKTGLDTKIRQAKRLAIVGDNKQFKKEHTDEVRDATSNNFTKLTNRVKSTFEDKQKERIRLNEQRFTKPRRD
jgi:hypothetical protein